MSVLTSPRGDRLTILHDFELVDRAVIKKSGVGEQIERLAPGIGDFHSNTCSTCIGQLNSESILSLVEMCWVGGDELGNSCYQSNFGKGRHLCEWYEGENKKYLKNDLSVGRERDRMKDCGGPSS